MTILTAHRPQNLSNSLLDVPCLPAFEVTDFMITFHGGVNVICDTEKGLQHTVTVRASLELAHL